MLRAEPRKHFSCTARRVAYTVFRNTSNNFGHKAMSLCVDRNVNCHQYPLCNSSACDYGKVTGINMVFQKSYRIHVVYIVFFKAILECWIGIMGSVFFSGILSILEDLLYLVRLFYTSNTKVWLTLSCPNSTVRFISHVTRQENLLCTGNITS
jgi:hypothetical protein